MRVQRTVMVCLLALLPATPIVAAQIYKCVGTDGRVSFQDTPCARQQQQQVLHDNNSPAAAASVPAPVQRDAPTPPRSPPASRPPPIPITLLFRCVRATDGKTYISGDGNPRPYRVPLGMIGGMGQLPLSQVYGGTHAASAGISAPELAPHASAALIGSNFTRVQDRCWQLNVQQTCVALQEQHDANAKKLRNAFDSDKPPLRKREAQLNRQMAGCRQ